MSTVTELYKKYKSDRAARHWYMLPDERTQCQVGILAEEKREPRWITFKGFLLMFGAYECPAVYLWHGDDDWSLMGKYPDIVEKIGYFNFHCTALLNDLDQVVSIGGTRKHLVRAMLGLDPSGFPIIVKWDDCHYMATLFGEGVQCSPLLGNGVVAVGGIGSRRQLTVYSADGNPLNKRLHIKSLLPVAMFTHSLCSIGKTEFFIYHKRTAYVMSFAVTNVAEISGDTVRVSEVQSDLVPSICESAAAVSLGSTILMFAGSSSGCARICSLASDLSMSNWTATLLPLTLPVEDKQGDLVVLYSASGVGLHYGSWNIPHWIVPITDLTTSNLQLLCDNWCRLGCAKVLPIDCIKLLQDYIPSLF